MTRGVSSPEWSPFEARDTERPRRNAEGMVPVEPVTEDRPARLENWRWVGHIGTVRWMNGTSEAGLSVRSEPACMRLETTGLSWDFIYVFIRHQRGQYEPFMAEVTQIKPEEEYMFWKSSTL